MRSICLLGLRPHILGLVYIFIGFANKNIGKRIMFCHSQTVMFKTLGNGDFRFIDILKISAYKMLPVAQKTFSLIFVSKKQKLKPSQGGEDSSSPRQLRRLRWFLRKLQLNLISSIYPTARSRGVAPNSAFSYFLSAEA